MAWYEAVPALSPRRIAALYLVLGVLWILSSDQLVYFLIGDGQTAAQIQSIKGVLFVAGSTAVLYGVTKTYALQQAETKRELRAVLQEVSVLDRILRHDVRNRTNVITAYLSNIERHVPESEQPAVDKIQTAVDRLLTRSEKASRLTRLLSGDGMQVDRLDIASVVSEAADDIAELYPDARITVTLPETATDAFGPTALDWILAELLENAIEHNDTETPTVRLSVTTTADDVAVTIEDNGPGLPANERDLAEETLESPLQHSLGVGLWTVRILVPLSGATYEISDDGTDGTSIQLEFPKSEPSMVRNSDLVTKPSASDA